MSYNPIVRPARRNYPAPVRPVHILAAVVIPLAAAGLAFLAYFALI